MTLVDKIGGGVISILSLECGVANPSLCCHLQVWRLCLFPVVILTRCEYVARV